MKKFIAPFVLLVLSVTLVIYLWGGFGGSGSSFDPDAYLAARAKIDSLEMALWDAQGNSSAQKEIREELSASWEALEAMRGESAVTAKDASAGVEDGEAASEASDKKSSSAKDSGILSGDNIKWIVGGAAAMIFCIVILIFIVKRRKEYLTRQMEAVNDDSTEGPSEPEIDFEKPQPRPKKTSIIADAEAYAAKKRETLAQQAQPKSDSPAPAPVTKAEQKVAFEDENGLPENKILTETPGKPTLRPTARERITSAMKNLSDVLRAPRGLSRERTMKLRAQSRNVTGDPNLGGSSPLETSRFDREANEKVKVLQLSRRGFPASAIASTLKIPQDKVEAIIKESLS